jgi:transcriptional regulator with XRE-family HTH domain
VSSVTVGDWNPERLREARAQLRDHGRPISQGRFAELVGVSKRTLERNESLTAPVAPKADALARIVTVTGQPVEFFFGSDADAPTAAEAGSFELALAQMFTRALDTRIRPLEEEIEELKRQQAAEGWSAGATTRSLTTTRRAA